MLEAHWNLKKKSSCGMDKVFRKVFTRFSQCFQEGFQYSKRLNKGLGSSLLGCIVGPFIRFIIRLERKYYKVAACQNFKLPFAPQRWLRSDWHKTLPKCVSDDLKRFIFRRRFFCVWKQSSQLWTCEGHWQIRLEN